MLYYRIKKKVQRNKSLIKINLKCQLYLGEHVNYLILKLKL